jgi:hypothetical protein
MRFKVLTLVAGLAAAGLVTASFDDAFAAPKRGHACYNKKGRGFAPTRDMAKFQAWEIVAQITGNWPIQTDTFRNETYRCKQDSSGWVCISSINVCKS